MRLFAATLAAAARAYVPPDYYDADRRLQTGGALPVVNSTSIKRDGQGRMNYTYLSPAPFGFPGHTDNIWALLCPDILLHDQNSNQLAAAYLHFDPDYYDDDRLRYSDAPFDVVAGSYNPGARTLVMAGTASVAHYQQQLRTVLRAAALFLGAPR